MNLKKKLYHIRFLLIKLIRRFLRLHPIVIFYVEDVQHLLIVKPVVDQAEHFYIFTESESITHYVNINKLKRKVIFCDAIVFSVNHAKDDFIYSHFFLTEPNIMWFQLFHGITDGFDNNTYSTSLHEYELLFCSSEHRYKKFLASGFDKDKLVLCGYPKYDVSAPEIKTFHTRKRILIIPTWGVRSALPFLDGSVLEKLGERYDVVISIHRLNNLHFWDAPLNKLQHIHILKDIDLLSEMSSADLIISDVSSAAYEFLLFDKPLILIDTPWNKYLKNDLANKGVIEYRSRNNYSFTIDARYISVNLVQLVGKALAHPMKHSVARRKLAKKLIYRDKYGRSASEIITDAIISKINS